MVQKFSFHTLHFPGTSAGSDHPAERSTACTLCAGTAFAPAMAFSSPEDREGVEMPPRGTSWQEAGRACTTSSCDTGFLGREPA